MKLSRRAIQLLIFAILISVLSLVQYNRTIYILYILQIVSLTIVVALIILEIYVSVILSKKREAPTPGRMGVLAITGLAILLIPLSAFYVRTDGGKKIVMVAGASSPSEFIDMHLYGDNTYKLLHSGPMSGIYYRGAYTYENDTLNIENERLDYLYPNQIFVYDKQKNVLNSAALQDSTDFKAVLIIKKTKYRFPRFVRR